MPEKTQDYKSHRRYVPSFHFFVLPVLVANVIIEGKRLFQNQDLRNAWAVVLAIALFVFAFAARGMAARAQDRVIRLEERLRLASLMSPDNVSKIGELTPAQLVALRFASDEEAPGLAERAMTGEFKSPEDIKKAVKNWRADLHRV
jgi:hypothetical protein